eukprot:9433877-Pyramimonas_sp.AAC.1
MFYVCIRPRSGHPGDPRGAAATQSRQQLVSSAGVAMPDEIEVAYALTQRQMEAVFAKNASAPKR